MVYVSLYSLQPLVTMDPSSDSGSSLLYIISACAAASWLVATMVAGAIPSYLSLNSELACLNSLTAVMHALFTGHATDKGQGQAVWPRQLHIHRLLVASLKLDVCSVTASKHVVCLCSGDVECRGALY